MSRLPSKPNPKKHRRQTVTVKSRQPVKQRRQKKSNKNAGFRSFLSSQRFSGLLVLLGSVVLLGSTAAYKAAGQLPVSDSLPRIESQTTNPAFIPEQLTISTLIDIPIIPGDYVDGSWTDSKEAAIYYTGSATPFSFGNTIIYAHNTANLFGKLKQVETGAIIALRLADNSIRQYEVIDIQEVDPSNVEPLQPTTDERLTLYTCSGWLDSKRLVITALPTTPVDLSEETPS